MAKKLNRALKLGGDSMNIDSTATKVLEFDIDNNVTRAQGTTLPADAQTGFAKDCLFSSTALNKVRHYTNVGSETYAKFAPLINPRATYEEFRTYPKFSKTDGYGDPTGSTGDENLLITEHNIFEYHILGTQTILKPGWDANGLDIGALDQTANDGIEVSQGITARSKTAFTVGTDPAFFLSVKFKVTDVSGTDDCAIGFRKVEAYQASVDSYDEMAAMNVISGDIKLETILNNASTATTDTTDNWADSAEKTLTVKVGSTGIVTYEIDGSAPTTTATFTFDDAEVVMPFFYFLQDSDITACYITKWECGYQ